MTARRSAHIRAGLAIFVLLTILVLVRPSAPAPDSDCRPSGSGYRCIYGPIEVRKGQNEILELVDAVPEPGYITSALVTLVDHAGKPLPQHAVHLHHTGVMNPNQPSLGCDFDKEPFYGTGKEGIRMSLPEGYGYYWDSAGRAGKANPDWWIYGDIRGLHADADLHVYLQLDLGFRAEPEGSLVEVRPLWLSVLGCRFLDEYVVQRGSGTSGEHVRSAEHVIPIAGRFVWGQAHLHDGGLELELVNTTTGEHILTSKALYEVPGKPSYLSGTTGFVSLQGVPVTAGDVLRLTAVYDSTRRRSAMGNLRTMFVPEP